MYVTSSSVAAAAATAKHLSSEIAYWVFIAFNG